VHATLFTKYQKCLLSLWTIHMSTKHLCLMLWSRWIILIVLSSCLSSYLLLLCLSGLSWNYLSVVSLGISIVVACWWFHKVYLSLSPESGFRGHIQLCHLSAETWSSSQMSNSSFTVDSQSSEEVLSALLVIKSFPRLLLGVLFSMLSFHQEFYFYSVLGTICSNCFSSVFGDGVGS